jgi:N6-adenosine-specific RNA methylase IME4
VSDQLERRTPAEAGTPDQVIALIESARADLQRVEDPTEAVQLTKRADSIKYLARKADASAETQNQAAEVALRARRRAGELLAAVPREERKGAGRPSKIAAHAEPQFTPYQKVLKDADIPLPTAKRFVQLAQIPEKQFEDHVTRTRADQLTTTAALRIGKEAGRQRQREDNQDLVDGTAPLPADPELRYQAIVIDPPWDWGDEGDADQLGRARPVYQTMSYEQLTVLPVGEQAAGNAHLYLWITNRSLPKGFGLLEAWGFRYVTMLTWCKPHFGMGNYFRGQTEHILFGVRGSLPLLRHDRGTWFQAARPGRHSSKPGDFYELVEECSPGPWLEMFSRSARPGWAAWGAEA